MPLWPSLRSPAGAWRSSEEPKLKNEEGMREKLTWGQDETWDRRVKLYGGGLLCRF